MPSSQSETVGDQELEALVAEAVSAVSKDAGLTPMKGFSLNLSANQGFRKVFFSARCGCGTAALLSVEVAQEKTLEQVRQVLPSLVGKLEAQARSFHRMPCQVHEKMRLGPAALGWRGAFGEGWMPRKLNKEEAIDRAVEFSERYVARGPYKFFPEPEVVRVVQEGLGENEMEHGYRYCP